MHVTLNDGVRDDIIDIENCVEPNWLPIPQANQQR